jgi:single-strand DNA-binding protein
MYNDTIVTVVGNIVDEPRVRETTNGHAVANLRIASTPRYFDREQGAWADGATLFLTVTCWRAMAQNVKDSLHTGQPVVVTGRFYQRDYEVNGSRRIAFELEATAIGHDLARGTAHFSRVYRPDGVGYVPVDEDGVPVDESDHWLNLSTHEESEQVDAGLGAPADSATDTATDGAAEQRELVTTG